MQKDNLSLMDQISKRGFSMVVAKTYVMLFGIGVICGFIFKKYLKLMFLSLILCLLAIKGMEINHLVTVDWKACYDFLGLSPSATFEEIAKYIMGTFSHNVYQTAVLLLGFLIGYKAG